MVRYELDPSQSIKLEETMKRIPDRAEKLVNEVLWTTGSKEGVQSITKFTPVSSKNKIHAKSSKPYKTKKENLGFEINTKKKFNYLVFPDKGIGRRNKKKQDFARRGLEQANNKIIELVLKALVKSMEVK